MFYNYAPAQNSVPQDASAEPEDGKECDFCGEFIELGHQAILLELCNVKRGPKSGVPFLELDPIENIQACLHRDCVPAFMFLTMGVEDDDYDEPLCSVCESRIYDD